MEVWNSACEISNLSDTTRSFSLKSRYTLAITLANTVHELCSHHSSRNWPALDAYLEHIFTLALIGFSLIRDTYLRLLSSRSGSSRRPSTGSKLFSRLHTNLTRLTEYVEEVKEDLTNV